MNLETALIMLEDLNLSPIKIIVQQKKIKQMQSSVKQSSYRDEDDNKKTNEWINVLEAKTNKDGMIKTKSIQMRDSPKNSDASHMNNALNNIFLEEESKNQATSSYLNRLEIARNLKKLRSF